MTPALVLALALSSAPLTLRVDYVHSGNATQERFALEALKVEGPWPGPPDRPVDDSGLGKYVAEVVDAASGRLLFSRGFASVYGEWETTGEAKERDRAFSETVRFPLPTARVELRLRKRGEDGVLRPVWALPLDPQDPSIDRAAPTGTVWAVVENGDPATKVDLLLLGDGYTAAEMDKWHADARRLAALLFSFSPFKERQADFNVWALDTPSPESGVSRPSDRVWHRTALGASYDAFGSERYVLALDNRRLRDAAGAAPYDFMEIVVNNQKYGGGGIHDLYATVAADSVWAPYLFVHEFGHHFAGLADEYYTSASVYEAGESRPEPWEPNVTADPRAAKWKDLGSAGTPRPTPWPKDAFETIQKDVQARRQKIRAEGRPEEEMDALFREERSRIDPLLHGERTGVVGAYEGALYQARGYYRPQTDCMMFSRANDLPFCAVCRRAIGAVIDRYSRPIR